MTTEIQPPESQPKTVRKVASRSGQIIPRGKNFLVRIYLGRDAVGKRQYSNKTIKTGRKNAEKYLTKALRDKDLGVFVEARQGNRLRIHYSMA